MEDEEREDEDNCRFHSFLEEALLSYFDRLDCVIVCLADKLLTFKSFSSFVEMKSGLDEVFHELIVILNETLHILSFIKLDLECFVNHLCTYFLVLELSCAVEFIPKKLTAHRFFLSHFRYYAHQLALSHLVVRQNSFLELFEEQFFAGIN